MAIQCPANPVKVALQLATKPSFLSAPYLLLFDQVFPETIEIFTVSEVRTYALDLLVLVVFLKMDQCSRDGVFLHPGCSENPLERVS